MLTHDEISKELEGLDNLVGWTKELFGQGDIDDLIDELLRIGQLTSMLAVEIARR